MLFDGKLALFDGLRQWRWNGAGGRPYPRRDHKGCSHPEARPVSHTRSQEGDNAPVYRNACAYLYSIFYRRAHTAGWSYLEHNPCASINAHAAAYADRSTHASARTGPFADAAHGR